MGLQVRESASPLCSVPVMENHSIRRGFKCEAQVLTLNNLSDNRYWANHSITGKLRKCGWVQATKSTTQVILQKQSGGYHCGGHGHTCQGWQHCAPPTSTDGHCCPWTTVTATPGDQTQPWLVLLNLSPRGEPASSLHQLPIGN